MKKDDIIPELILYSSPSTDIRVTFLGLFLLLELGTSISSAESAGGGITSCFSSFSSPSFSFPFSSDVGSDSEMSFISISAGLDSSSSVAAGVSEGVASASIFSFSVFSPSVLSLVPSFDCSGSANLVQSEN